MLVLRGGAGVAARSLTFEEVHSLKAAADGLAAACRARASQARMMARALDAAKRGEVAEERLEALRHEWAGDAARHALAAMRLAWPASVGAYSAASRMALETLERRTALGAPIAVVAPSGVDPVPYLARAHLSGARRAGPLVVVDGASTVEHDVGRWADPGTSPLTLAEGGMLVLLDGAALPASVQQFLASALAQKRAPWERPTALDVQLALTGVAAPDDLVAQARLDESLAVRLGDARQRPTVLPRLRERSDDLRAILTDRFAREGLRVLGRPVGIEQAAYARLIDYRFPGEDAELASIVQRLVARCTGDLVRAADVEALRLRSESTEGRRKDPLSA
jgi:DNA-binding NtrC family response regulator